MQAVAPAIHLPLCSCLVPEVMVIRSCGVPGTWAKMGGFLLSPLSPQEEQTAKSPTGLLVTVPYLPRVPYLSRSCLSNPPQSPQVLGRLMVIDSWNNSQCPSTGCHEVGGQPYIHDGAHCLSSGRAGGLGWKPLEF